MKQIKNYPAVERLEECNVVALALFHIKKHDKAETLSKPKLMSITSTLQEMDGDLYDKATFLMKSPFQQHPFASGNRRTAFIATKDFVFKNKGTFEIKDDASYARVMLGIREKFYKDSDIKAWIQTGEIHGFTR